MMNSTIHNYVLQPLSILRALSEDPLRLTCAHSNCSVLFCARSNCSVVISVVARLTASQHELEAPKRNRH